MKKFILFFVFAFAMQASFAAFVPEKTTGNGLSENVQTQNLVKSLTIEEFELVIGKKLTRIQKWQYKKLQRKLQSSNMGIFPEREELTEGFQALPFFGAIFTLGISALVMVFTAQDKNAMRWAMNGICLLAIALAAMSLVGSLSGY